jgi:hypothetical protein
VTPKLHTVKTKRRKAPQSHLRPYYLPADVRRHHLPTTMARSSQAALRQLPPPLGKESVAPYTSQIVVAIPARVAPVRLGPYVDRRPHPTSAAGTTRATTMAATTANAARTGRGHRRRRVFQHLPLPIDPHSTSSHRYVCPRPVDPRSNQNDVGSEGLCLRHCWGTPHYQNSLWGSKEVVSPRFNREAPSPPSPRTA